MIVARVTQNGGAGETTLALHLSGHWAAQGKRLTLVEADPQGSVLHSSEQPTGKRQERLFAVIALIHRETPERALLADLIIDGSSRAAALLRSAPLAADTTQVPAQPSPFDGWASTGVPVHVAETRVLRVTMSAHVALRRRPTGSSIAHDAARSLADHDTSALASHIAQHLIFAEAARSEQLEQRQTASRRPRSTRDRAARRRVRRASAPRRAGARQGLGGASARPDPRRPRPLPRSEDPQGAASQGHHARAPRPHQDRLPARPDRRGHGSRSSPRTNSPRAMEAPL